MKFNSACWGKYGNQLGNFDDVEAETPEAALDLMLQWCSAFGHGQPARVRVVTNPAQFERGPGLGPDLSKMIDVFYDFD